MTWGRVGGPDDAQVREVLEAQAIIERVRRISATLQRLDLAVEAGHRDVAPGQFFLARTGESYDPYLREPWIPVGRRGAHIVVERPAGQVYTPGQIVNLVGPVGKPIPAHPATRALLLIAWDASPASLLMLADLTLGRGGAVTLALIGHARRYPLDALPAELEVLFAADLDGWPERERSLTWADQVIAVAPPAFASPAYSRLLEAIRLARLEVAAGFALGLFHAPMPCGVGACQACLVSLKGGDVAACVEGPAFDLLEVRIGGDREQR